eukprot:TRINITY_DN3887_c0_g3_i1.p1 TRINITY_DN3887_c0_g3~~TRINITY_DN3887_c0_g3_i1.p1  ORF type:complete len:368 (-),score=19.67 TRINITY_DN3887_c0_g3_i1:228-1331(-)
MGKSFDALCFIVILIAAAPHFSRGGGCCKRIMANGVENTCDTVMECIMAVEEGDGNLTHVVLTKTCRFGLNETQPRVVLQDVIIRSEDRNALLFPPSPIEISFRRNLTFSGVTINGRSTVKIFSAETESSATFTGCTVLGVNMVFETFVHVNVRSTHFDMYEAGPPMLQIEKGSLEFVGGGNDVKCIFECNSPTIKVNVCRDVIIKEVGLFQGGGNNASTFEFSPCEQAVETVPTLTIESIRFNGLIPDTLDLAWVIVRGDVVKGPMVILKENDYDEFADQEEPQMGKVFRFIGNITQRRSNFTLSRSSRKSPPSGWDVDDCLATAFCYDDAGNLISSDQIRPIGPNTIAQEDVLCSASVNDRRLLR